MTNLICIPDLEQDLPIAMNSEQRTPTIIAADTSLSMELSGQMPFLNDGLQALKKDLTTDPRASRRVEVALLTFGGQVEVLNDFLPPSEFHPPVLKARGNTPMGEVIHRGLDLIHERRATYNQYGVPSTTPWFFVFSDGRPTDAWQSAARRVHKAEAEGHCLFFAVGVQGADMDILKQIAPTYRPPVTMKGIAFREMFEWLSQSLKVAYMSTPGQQIALPSPDGWAEIRA